MVQEYFIESLKWLPIWLTHWISMFIVLIFSIFLNEDVQSLNLSSLTMNYKLKKEHTTLSFYRNWVKHFFFFWETKLSKTLGWIKSCLVYVFAMATVFVWPFLFIWSQTLYMQGLDMYVCKWSVGYKYNEISTTCLYADHCGVCWRLILKC